MKFKNILLATLVLTAFSCEDFIGGDLNADPNKPLTVPIAGVLPQVQISLADTYGGSFSRWNCMFTQQVAGVARQWTSFNQYSITPNRFDDSWADMYENVLVELLPVKAEATENGYNHYLGIANVLEAYAIMAMTDVWGDIPYTEAGLGSDNFNPVYDDQATVIYPAVFRLLNEALTLFTQTSGEIVPGADDLYYGGDVDQWTKAANAILARYHLHLGDNAAALAAAKLSFEDRSDNMAYQYGADPHSGQWYRFNNGREGDIEFAPFMKGLMESLNDDDRLTMMDQVFTINGDTPHPYMIARFRQDLISYREIQFIIAETSTNPAEAHAAYLNGIEASFEELGFAAGGDEYSDYIGQANVNPGVGAITLNHIITQKYIGMFVQPEVWSDWRRTGIPALTPISGSEGVPTSWDYAFASYLFNSNAPDQNDGGLFRTVDWNN
ncbi:MAG: SusD/RagB family nutrient-binding outer membrane lipoprotein [Cyclobacteriaceae bacterium]